MAPADGLLRSISKNDKFAERQRTSSAYNPMYSYRLSRGGQVEYKQQFGDMYFLRLAKLKPAIEHVAEEEWADFEIAGEQAQRVERVLDVRQGQLCWVVGTIFMDMPLKPNILEDISKEHWVAGPPPRQSYFSNHEETQVMLEDASGRLRLTGLALRSNILVTGVILAVLGTENANGDFDVLDMHIPELSPQPRRWLRDDEEEDDGMAVDRPAVPGKKIALVSGLSFSGSEADTLTLSLLTDFLLGESLDETEQDRATDISRLVIAGNSISATAISDTINPHDEVKKPAHKKYGYDASAYNPTPTAHFDQFLSELLPSIPVTVMPGENDPANSSLPQQPIHPAMFPHARNYSCSNFEDPESEEPGWFDSTTNPTSFDLEGFRYLGTSGQNLDDILKYLPAGGPSGIDAEGRLEVMEAMLRWRCVAPTAPDTLWCYPFQDRDQFVIEESPHVFFIGNQPKFDTAVLSGADGQKVRMITIPAFRETGQIVLLDAETLEPEVVQFEVDSVHATNGDTIHLPEQVLITEQKVRYDRLATFSARTAPTLTILSIEMLVNASTAIKTNKVILTPYLPQHVPKYHEWMQDPDIQKATASESLTIDEEYAMQKSWREDGDKLTFIVYAASTDEECDGGGSMGMGLEELGAVGMIGDVNLFLSLDDEDDRDENGNGKETRSNVVGEIELMIAGKIAQGKGYGRAALLAFLMYVLTHEAEFVKEFMVSCDCTPESVRGRLDYLRVKIGKENLRSIGLFESVGFKKIGEVPNFFGEFELRRYGLKKEDVENMMRRKRVEGWEEEGFRP